MLKRLWWRGTEDTRRALAHLAIDLDTTAEKLAGLILADVVSKVGEDAEQLRRLLPKAKS